MFKHIKRSDVIFLHKIFVSQKIITINETQYIEFNKESKRTVVVLYEVRAVVQDEFQYTYIVTNF